jgi:hypothetical protein
MNRQDYLNLISNPTINEPVKLSEEDIERETRLVELNIKKEHLESNRQDRIERKNYAVKVYWLIVAFLSVSMLVMIASGIHSLCFSLSDNVLIILLTTSCASVIGVFLVVMRYLFRQPPDEKS